MAIIKLNVSIKKPVINCSIQKKEIKCTFREVLFTYNEDYEVDFLANHLEGAGNIKITEDEQNKKVIIDDTHDHDSQYLKKNEKAVDSSKLDGKDSSYYTTAQNITYDNSTSGLSSTNVQDAIDELDDALDNLSTDAKDINYDNTTSGLSATNVQDALDEIDNNVDSLESDVSNLNNEVSGLNNDVGNLSNEVSNLSNELDAHKTDTNNPHNVVASQVSYDNTTSGLSADNVQSAIDEVVSDLISHINDQNNPHNVTALQVAYDNSVSGLDANNVQSAIDNLSGGIGLVFKNIIINGDMQVSQRGTSFFIKNKSIYTLDRVRVTAQNGNEVEVRASTFYGSDEGSKVSVHDFFGDGSAVLTLPLDGNANDLGGNWNGTWHGTEQYDSIKARFGQGAKFNGSSWIQLPDGLENYFIGSNPFTVSCWFLHYTFTGDWTRILDFRGRFLLTLQHPCQKSDGSGEVAKLCVVHYPNDFSEEGVDFITDRTLFKYWFNNMELLHCVAVFDGSNYRLYINGNRLPITIGSAPPSTPNAPANLLAKSSWTADPIANCLIDQLRIFNRALSDDEVRKLYLEGDSYKYKPHLFVRLLSKSTPYSVIPYEYRFEGQHLYPILGKYATLSFLFASSKEREFTVRLKYPDGSLFASQTFTYNRSGEFQQVSITFDFSQLDISKIDLGVNLGLILTIAENDEIDEGDWIRITDVQLEKGKRATEFERLPYEIQLNRCMRYYERVRLNAPHVNGTCCQAVSYFFKARKGRIPSISYIKDSGNISTISKCKPMLDKVLITDSNSWGGIYFADAEL